MSRDPALLAPAVRLLHGLHVQAVTAAGLKVLTTYTLRTPEEQAALYSQGRKPLEHVNALRKAAGLCPITASQNAAPVTWTQKSRHQAGPDGLSRAYDLALVGPGGLIWDPKADCNANREPDWSEVVRLARGLELPAGDRLRCGADFGDCAHFELAVIRG